MSLGNLEQQAMEIFWRDPDRDFTVREISDLFADHAYTTIMTVLTRLAQKGFLSESKNGRLNMYRATAAKSVYIQSLIDEALSLAPDRQAALAHFATNLADDDRSFFQKFLQRRG